MRKHLGISLTVAGALLLAACSSTTFDSTWKSPDAKNFTGSFQGKKVLAVILAKETGTRRAGEDVLAAELTKRGAQGVPSYRALEGIDTTNEAAAKAALEKVGFVGAVTMRPVAKDKEIVSTPGMYTGGMYGGYWGGYYGHGWGGAYSAPTVQTNTIISVETLIYSLKENKLIWSGRSRTTNPSKLDSFIKEIVSEAGSEMKKEGLL